MSIKEYFSDWYYLLDIKELNYIINHLNPYNLCPHQSNVFKAFKLCAYKDLKVVFLGQDPYPQKDIATGILFGNNTTKESDLSPSLKVIKNCCIDYSIPHNNIIFDNSLESWAKQGILMLNSALTCEINKVGSHIMLWRNFIIYLIKMLSHRNFGIIYVLFGKQAQTFEPFINKDTNVIIKVNHPAYYARINKDMPNIFKQIDKLLINKYGESIKWFTESL